MKILITLNNKKESIDFLNQIDIKELKDCLDFVYIRSLDITLRGNFTMSMLYSKLWFESEENKLFFAIPLILIKDFVIKEVI